MFDKKVIGDMEHRVEETKRSGEFIRQEWENPKLTDQPAL